MSFLWRLVVQILIIWVGLWMDAALASYIMDLSLAGKIPVGMDFATTYVGLAGIIAIGVFVSGYMWSTMPKDK